LRLVATVQPADGLDVLWQSYRRSLVARRRASGTIARYEQSIRFFGAYLQDHGLPMAPTEGNSSGGTVRQDGGIPPSMWQRQHLEAWMAHLLATGAPATAAGHYRALKTFMAWCVDEEEINVSPMQRMHAPTVPVTPPPVVDADTVRRLLEAAKGRGLEERRDTAIILLLSATGMRRGELVGMKVSDVDLEQGTAVISGKTGTRTVAFPAVVAVAVDRYLRVRSHHRRSALPTLWLGHRGAMTGNGVLQLVQRRARIANISQHIWPHLLRHTFVHNALSAGMSELDVETLCGWASGDMLRRYGASQRGERAISSYRRLFQ
jgi:site-specific recombinase XerD